MAENEFLIPTKALRDEGTSYHYLPAARYAEPASEAVQAIEKTFRALGLPFRECITWTTDGFSEKQGIWWRTGKPKAAQR